MKIADQYCLGRCDEEHRNHYLLYKSGDVSAITCPVNLLVWTEPYREPQQPFTISWSFDASESKFEWMSP